MIRLGNRVLVMLVKRAWELFKEGGLTHLRDEIGWFLWRKVGTQLFRNPVIGRVFFRTGMRAHRCLGFSRYTDANPFKIIFINPDDIKYYYSGPPRGWGRVVGGEWDLDREPLSEQPLFSAVENHFIHGVNWKQTDLWDEYRQHNLSEAEINDALDQIEELHESIKSDGYKSQRELLQTNPKKTYQRNNDAIHPSLNEVAVNIFRDGTLGKKYSGNHRLAVARVLNIKEIPVLIRTRHREWQHLRDKIRKSNIASSEINISHPDLEDILN